MITIKVKTQPVDFEEATDNGYIYGYIQKQKALPVYVELGQEREYNSSPQDNPKTEYRIFRHCNVFLAETDE